MGPARGNSAEMFNKAFTPSSIKLARKVDCDSKASRAGDIKDDTVPTLVRALDTDSAAVEKKLPLSVPPGVLLGIISTATTGG
jgi:hypothetical protein